MKKVYADIINEHIQDCHFKLESEGEKDTFTLGMRLLALHFAIKDRGETETENEICAMIDDCRRGIIPKPASDRPGVMHF